MRRDDILLVDMLLAAREAVDFARGTSEESFEHDRLRQLAVIKAIEIIGEAASKMSDDFRTQHPELPWREIIGMRHRLVHDYFEIDLPRVWKTVREDIPSLIAALEPLVPEAEG